MAKIKRRGRPKYKFTKKKESLWGIIAMACSIVALIVFIAAVVVSVSCAGEADIYNGSRGMLALLFSIAALVLGMEGLRQRDTYKLYSTIGTFAGLILTICFIIIYLTGILF